MSRTTPTARAGPPMTTRLLLRENLPETRAMMPKISIAISARQHIGPDPLVVTPRGERPACRHARHKAARRPALLGSMQAPAVGNILRGLHRPSGLNAARNRIIIARSSG